MSIAQLANIIPIAVKRFLSRGLSAIRLFSLRVLSNSYKEWIICRFPLFELIYRSHTKSRCVFLLELLGFLYSRIDKDSPDRSEVNDSLLRLVDGYRALFVNLLISRKLVGESVEQFKADKRIVGLYVNINIFAYFVNTQPALLFVQRSNLCSSVLDSYIVLDRVFPYSIDHEDSPFKSWVNYPGPEESLYLVLRQLFFFAQMSSPSSGGKCSADSMHFLLCNKVAHPTHLIWNNLAPLSSYMSSCNKETVNGVVTIDSQHNFPQSAQLYGDLETLFQAKVFYEGYPSNPRSACELTLRYGNKLLKVAGSSIAPTFSELFYPKAKTTCKPISYSGGSNRARECIKVIINNRVGRRRWINMLEEFQLLCAELKRLGLRFHFIYENRMLPILPKEFSGSSGGELYGGYYLSENDKAQEKADIERFGDVCATFCQDFSSFHFYYFSDFMNTARDAKFFIAPDGASLAKYKWILNLRGVVAAHTLPMESIQRNLLEGVFFYDSPKIFSSVKQSAIVKGFSDGTGYEIRKSFVTEMGSLRDEFIRISAPK